MLNHLCKSSLLTASLLLSPKTFAQSVSPANGNFSYTVELFRLGDDLNFRCTYNSLSLFKGMLSRGWGCNVETLVTFVRTSNHVLVEESGSGRKLVFGEKKSDSFSKIQARNAVKKELERPIDYVDSVLRATEKKFVETDKNVPTEGDGSPPRDQKAVYTALWGAKQSLAYTDKGWVRYAGTIEDGGELYGPKGRLIGFFDKRPGSLSVEIKRQANGMPSAIVIGKKTLAFVYDAKGRLSEINEAKKKLVSFDYNKEGNLSSLNSFIAGVKNFTYKQMEKRYSLASIYSERTTEALVQYDQGTNRVKSFTDKSGIESNFDYKTQGAKVLQTIVKKVSGGEKIGTETFDYAKMGIGKGVAGVGELKIKTAKGELTKVYSDKGCPQQPSSYEAKGQSASLKFDNLCRVNEVDHNSGNKYSYKISYQGKSDLVANVKLNGKVLFSADYNDDNKLKELASGSGAKFNLDYKGATINSVRFKKGNLKKSLTWKRLTKGAWLGDQQNVVQMIKECSSTWKNYKKFNTSQNIFNTLDKQFL